MHLSECSDSFRSRWIVDLKRHFPGSCEEEAYAEDKSAEQEPDRGSHAAPDFSGSRKLWPG